MLSFLPFFPQSKMKDTLVLLTSRNKSSRKLIPLTLYVPDVEYTPHKTRSCTSPKAKPQVGEIEK